MIQVRNVRLADDYEKLQAFWTAKGLPAVPREHLPPMGRVAESSDGTLLCGAFLVKSDTPLASICFISANPAVEPATRSKALDLLIFSLIGLAKQSGFTLVSVATNVPALQRRYERLGFVKTDENVICYAGRV